MDFFSKIGACMYIFFLSVLKIMEHIFNDWNDLHFMKEYQKT